jgi:predicted metal-dependent peptidase
MKLISDAIKKLMMAEPYYGLYLSGLKKEYVDDIDTAGVCLDGIDYKLVVNKQWFSGLTPNERMGILKHEALHLVFFHVIDGKTLYAPLANNDHNLLNVAMDLEVQSYIEPQYRWNECTAEKLFKDFPNLPRKMGTKFYIEFLKQIQKYDPKNPPQNKESQGGNFQSAKQHLQEGTGNSHSNWGDLTDTQKDLAKSQIEFQAKEVAKNTQKSRGTWPAELTEMLEALLKPNPPVFNWKAYFRRLLGIAFDIYQKKTRRKESLRFPESPGLKRKKKHKLLVAIDTSGSVCEEELQEFFSEIYHIWKAGADVHVLECDAKINKEWDYKGKPPKVVSGRGGTAFTPCVDYYNEHRKDYTTMVYFTDGYGDQDRCKPLNKMLWVITSNGYQESEFPGIKICIPKKQNKK